LTMVLIHISECPNEKTTSKNQQPKMHRHL
jgi:hypothetical protein